MLRLRDYFEQCKFFNPFLIKYDCWHLWSKYIDFTSKLQILYCPRNSVNTITHCLWVDQPTNFKSFKAQNSFKLKKSEKICNRSLAYYVHVLQKRVLHKMSFYAFFSLFFDKNQDLRYSFWGYE